MEKKRKNEDEIAGGKTERGFKRSEERGTVGKRERSLVCY